MADLLRIYTLKVKPLTDDEAEIARLRDRFVRRGYIIHLRTDGDWEVIEYVALR